MEDIKENKPFYKKGWFIAIAIIFLLAIIIPAFMEKSNIQNTSSKNENVKPEKPKKTDSEVIKEIEARIKEYQQSMKKYYPTKEMLTTLNDDWLKLIVAEETYKNAIEKEQKLIYEKAKALFPVVDRIRRQVYAKLIESEMLDKGFNYEVSAQGKNNEILKIKYALMSNALIYNLRNKANLDKSAHKLGFKKIIFTDGFDRTWTVDLSK